MEETNVITEQITALRAELEAYAQYLEESGSFQTRVDDMQAQIAERTAQLENLNRIQITIA